MNHPLLDYFVIESDDGMENDEKRKRRFVHIGNIFIPIGEFLYC